MERLAGSNPLHRHTEVSSTVRLLGARVATAASDKVSYESKFLKTPPRILSYSCCSERLG